MNIIFDIDDTITNETEFMKKNAPRFLKKKYNINVEECEMNENGYNVAETYNLPKYLKENSIMDDNEIKLLCKKITNDFWNTYFLKYMIYPIRTNVKKIIESLKNEGYNIYFLSSRGKKTKENDTKLNEFIRTKVVPFLTKFQLKINGIEYNQIQLVQNEEEKIEFIKKIKPIMVFDDQTSLLEKISNETIAICINNKHNEKKEISDNIKRLESYEMANFNEIMELIGKPKSKNNNKKYKNIKVSEKIYTESFYKVTRMTFGQGVKNKMKPHIVGTENIPQDNRAVVYVGNHRNNFDPVIAVTCIKNPTHFAALLRLFQAKENLFGRNDIEILKKISAFIIKSEGCIPIARETDENYQKININSMLKIDEYIKMGSSIGYFPEGTLNRNPENCNILPLKSDAIFAIAKRNNSWIQPFAIVWTPKDINIENKVFIEFAEPIEPTGMTTEEIRNLWLYRMNEKIDEINAYFDEIRKNSIQEDNKDKRKVFKGI